MKRLAVMLFAISLVTGCSDGTREGGGSAPAASPASFVPTGTDEEQVQQIVKRYNQLLAEGYRTLNMTRLTEVATQNQAEKAYIHMAAIGEGKARMLSALKKIDFATLKRENPDTFVAKTKEVWDFSYTDIKTGEESGKVDNFIYEVTYTLKKEGPRWVIQEIVAFAPDDREEPRTPRVIRPQQEKKESAPAALPPGHMKVAP